ncbi:MAG: SDR family NAD(P)-dependent oxidoreductase [Clostridia bacterium]|nr:SDR family NAD(P)-dependent oxidoreductase [Clostridia bacterium]
MAYTYISGACGGIGKAFTVACAKKGYDLFLTGRSKERLESLKNEITASYNVKIITFPCDLTSETSRAELFDFVKENDVRLDRIINVAGVDTQKPFSAYTQEKLLFQIRVNAESTAAITLGLLPFKEKQLEIITISSMSGVSPMPYFAVYSATKAMLINLFTSLHYELKKDGVKVTTVLPGGVPTRPDIIANINEQGLGGKLSAKPASFVAEKSLKAVKKNKIKYVPGFFNKFLNFTMKIIPQRIVLKVISNRWKNISGKDAF